MKRLVPYIFLQLLLASLMGCAAMRAPENHESRSVYRITLVVASAYTEDMTNVLASIPGASLTGPLHIAAPNPASPAYEQFELCLPDNSAVQTLRSALQNAAVPLSGFHVQEVSL